MDQQPGLGQKDNPLGLSVAEAAARALRFGPNRLPQPPRPGALRRLGAQFGQFFSLMLWVAGGLAILAGMPELGVAIFVVIVINAVFAFVQENRAERASQRLRDLLPQRATVIRGGRRQEVNAAAVVPDDVMVIQAGDRIAADVRLSMVSGLMLDESTLSGESQPVEAAPAAIAFAGSFAVEGEGLGLVQAIGSATRLAGIAQLASARPRPETPLAREIRRLVRIIALVSVSVGAVFLAVALGSGFTPRDGFIFAVGVTVAMVPEGLLPTVTLALAMAAQRMARRQALVRRLESVETLGSTTFICTDKTGTLTQNEMAVVAAWTPAGEVRLNSSGYDPTLALALSPEVQAWVHPLALTAVRGVSANVVQRGGRWMAQGNPLEAALVVLARRLGFDLAAEDAAHAPQRSFAFDPRRRLRSLVTDGAVLACGAPEAVLARCAVESASAHTAAETAAETMASQGWRVLAVARRPLDAAAPLPAVASDAECQLQLLGLLGIADAPRPEAADAIAACRRAGIRLAMITGDHPATARAIAREVGLATNDGSQFEGNDLPQDEAALGALLDHDGVIVSRVAPEQKLRIARALRARGHVVAMTGDGVNDAPALHEADIGVAMGRSGTDVAREAADLVLLDDNFATIVAAIELGRATFANVRRFLTYHLTDNIAELAPFVLWALTGTRLPLALGVLQVLGLDIGTDVLPAVALGAEPPSPQVLNAAPTRQHLADRALLVRAFLILGLTEAVVEMAAFWLALRPSGWHFGQAFPPPTALAAASGAAFAAVVLGQMGNVFACRSTRVWPGRLGWFTNRLLLWAVGAELGITALFFGIPAVARLLGQTPPRGAGLIAALLAAPAVLAVDALHKRLPRAARPRGSRRCRGLSSADAEGALQRGA